MRSALKFSSRLSCELEPLKAHKLDSSWIPVEFHSESGLKTTPRISRYITSVCQSFQVIVMGPAAIILRIIESSFLSSCLRSVILRIMGFTIGRRIVRASIRIVCPYESCALDRVRCSDIHFIFQMLPFQANVKT